MGRSAFDDRQTPERKLVGVNARMLYAWHDARGLPTPWDPDAPDNGPRLRRANRNKPRRRHLGAPQVSPPAP